MPSSAETMDDTGSAGSLIKVAGLGSRLALVLNAVACHFANSGVDVHSISKGISLFALMLKQIGQTIQSENSNNSQEALDTAREIAERAQVVFDEIQDMLDQVQRSGAQGAGQSLLVVQQRFKSCFKKQRVTYLLAYLESLKLNLTVMLQILQLDQLIRSKDSLSGSPADDTIAQGRVEIQNMIVVRYWTIKRLDRLWDLSREEAMECEKDEMNRTIDSSLSPATSSSPRSSSSSGITIAKLPVVALGQSDSSLSAIEQAPTNMLKMTEAVLELLLPRWTRTSGRGKSRQPEESNGGAGGVRQVYVSSDSDEVAFGSDFDGHDIQGYYLEGATTDWRKPHSQEARNQATQLKKRFSGYQPTVESDSEEYDSSSTRSRSPKDESRMNIGERNGHDTEQDQASARNGRSATNVENNRTQSRQFPNSYPGDPDFGNDRGSPVSSNATYRESRPTHQPQSQSRSQPQPQPQSIPSPKQRNTWPERPSTSPRSPTSPSPGFSTSPQVPYRGASTYRYHAPNLSPPSPSTGLLSPQAPRCHPPARGYPRSYSDRTYSLSSSPSRPRSRKSTSTQRADGGTDRHGNSSSSSSKRSATRGILGVTAIAGFLDALEAFSIF
ncbi:hypothetical protein V8E54_012611 [Elaphomyces granulatus]